MSLVKLTEDKFERFTLVTNPPRTFSSSSLGVTGSVNLFARENRILKESETYFSSSLFFDETKSVETVRLAVKKRYSLSTNINGYVNSYMTKVNNESLSARRDTSTLISRFTPGLTIDKEHLKKQVVVNQIMPYYANRYNNSNYSFTNYHTLNFFTASSVPSNTVMIYPPAPSLTGDEYGYAPSKGFTFECQLNPRYTIDSEGDEFNAGTILHMSSTMAVSLVTGSGIDSAGKPTTYRIMLQLSHSADVKPSEIDLTIANNERTFPNDMIFLSSDNIIKKNNWHHIAVRWGTERQNDGTGSFVIDSETAGIFSVPSASIKSATTTPLFLGNYYYSIPASSPARFFNNYASDNEGVTNLVNNVLDPVSFSFTHPLNAEIHDIKLYNSYQSIQQISTSSIEGPDNLDGLLFYVPVFFVRETRSRNVLKGPKAPQNKETFTPFNSDFAFTVGGHISNLESFVREFVNGEYPRLWNLTSSLYEGPDNSTFDANDYMYTKPVHNKRNLTVLPNDNGKFVPNFQLLMSGTVIESAVSGTATERFKNDTGALDLQLITLRDSADGDPTATQVAGELGPASNLPSPTTPLRVATGPVGTELLPVSSLTVLLDTKDSSSNQSVFFDISNLYFGRRIMPETFSATDINISGSDGKISLTLRDDGFGNLYRADSDTDHAKWSSVGNVFYNEGIVVVKTPMIPFFGKDQFDIALTGERNIYTTKMNILAGAAEINSSSNPSYLKMSASLNANDTNSEFVQITNITYHDENLNVVARTNLAQPVVKRSTDKILFRTKLDW
tara:strand:- start:829 stop:3189 length:2361 start_codon:yes stop_codon:yes gene_type:complete